jgi:hypothetical protein
MKLGLEWIVQEGLERGEKEAQLYDRYGAL